MAVYGNTCKDIACITAQGNRELDALWVLILEGGQVKVVGAHIIV